MATVIHKYVSTAQKKKPASQWDDERVQGARAKRQQNEMLLAKARGELIRKDVVVRQAAFLLVALRQRIINLPSTYARRFTKLTSITAAQKLLREMSTSLLNEIKDLPQVVTDPSWLRRLEQNENSDHKGPS